MHEERIWMSMMGSSTIFLDSKSSKKVMDLHQSDQVYKKTYQEIWALRCKDMQDSLATTTKLDRDEQGKNVDMKLYYSIIDSLLYLTASRLDIIFSVSPCARFQSCPKESHIIMIKRIIRYLKGTIKWACGIRKPDNFPWWVIRMPTMFLVQLRACI